MERLRLEERQKCCDPLPARFRQRRFRCGLGEEARHRAEVEQRGVQVPDRRLEAFRASAGIRAVEVRTENVRKLLRETGDDVAQTRCFRILHHAPRVGDKTLGQCGIAIDERSVDLEGGAGAAEAAAQRFVITCPEALRGRVPQCRKRPFDALGQQHPQLSLEAQHVPRHPLGVVTLGQILQEAIDDGGKRLNAVCAATVGDQHQRKVVTQRGEIAVAREQRGAQRERIDGLEAGGGALAREVKRNLRLKQGFHDGVPECQALRRRSPSDPCGHTVNLSNSASSPALMRAVVRNSPVLRRSS